MKLFKAGKIKVVSSLLHAHFNTNARYHHVDRQKTDNSHAIDTKCMGIIASLLLAVGIPEKLILADDNKIVS